MASELLLSGARGLVPPTLELCTLGPMELLYRGEPIPLPRSKKCRALLGYLAVTARAHRRERLCSLLWDVNDDPRGALRWTLSRLRSVLPEGVDPFEAERQSIAIRPGAVRLDAAELSALRSEDVRALPTEVLEAAAGAVRGEFLEGLDLPDFLDFTAWCVAEREALRRVHSSLLSELVRRLRDAPARALPWARHWARIDALDLSAHESLLELLLAEGFVDEAERRREHTVRQLRQVDPPQAQALERAFRVLRARGAALPSSAAPAEAVPSAPSVVDPRELASAVSAAAPAPFVGRSRVLQRVRDLLAGATRERRTQALLITAEPGAGKTRLLERAGFEAAQQGMQVLSARAFDLERGRPFGPWIDALKVPPHALAERAQAGGRALLFAELTALVREAAHEHAGIVLIFDDLQWLDRDSAEALHHLLQSYAPGPLLVLLSARAGELLDNAAVMSVLRSLRRDRTLQELELAPLSRDEVLALLGPRSDLDVEQVMKSCAGNPLYALELARGAREGHEGTPPTLLELVRERVGRLSDAARDVLRWGAVLGYAFDADRLEALSELPQMDVVDALEALERHALLCIDVARSRERYTFSHDVVREAVYGELSHPRKRLMHRKVARLLQEQATEASTAHEVARHASLAGEVELGVRACIAAAQYALRICANADAETLAKRGLHLAAELPEAARVEATLDLLHVLYSARTPDRNEATERVRPLAERALDLGLTKAARVGFQMLSYLRWESSSMADAHENILQAERVSRSSDPEERSQALAHAARCLVLLERNLGQAEAFLMEASGVAERSGRTSAAVAFALAMIAAHRGEADVAEGAFREAQDLARAGGERLAELGALEHRLMLALDLDRLSEACSMAEALVDLAGRVRPGAEVAIARSLRALSALRTGQLHADDLREAVLGLRVADAKYELSFVLTRWAAHALERGELDTAVQAGEDALQVAQAIGRASESVIAQCILALAAHAAGDGDQAETRLRAIAGIAEADLSATARRWLARTRSASRARSQFGRKRARTP